MLESVRNQKVQINTYILQLKKEKNSVYFAPNIRFYSEYTFPNQKILLLIYSWKTKVINTYNNFPLPAFPIICNL